jgi:membrane protein implicated in regulation of membrane protease activity
MNVGSFVMTAETVVWIAAIIIFGVAEAATVGLVSIWFVLGSVAGLITAVLGGPVWLQVVLFFVVSIAALIITRPLVARMKKDNVATNADRVLGGTARVTEQINNTVPTGAVYIDGKTWSARSTDETVIPVGQLVRVVRMEGVRLFVEPSGR